MITAQEVNFSSTVTAAFFSAVGIIGGFYSLYCQLRRVQANVQEQLKELKSLTSLPHDMFMKEKARILRDGHDDKSDLIIYHSVCILFFCAIAICIYPFN